MQKHNSIESNIVERVMRMGIEFRTGKYTIEDLWSKAAYEIKQKKSNTTLSSKSDLDIFDHWKKLSQTQLLYALVNDKKFPEIIRCFNNPLSGRHLIRWRTTPKFTETEWLSGLPELSSPLKFERVIFD